MCKYHICIAVSIYPVEEECGVVGSSNIKLAHVRTHYSGSQFQLIGEDGSYRPISISLRPLHFELEWVISTTLESKGSAHIINIKVRAK